MSMQGKNLKVPDKRLAAVCGLFCPACTVFIGTREDPQRLRTIAERVQKPLEELHCDGCRSGERCFYCRERCKMGTCAQGEGVDFLRRVRRISVLSIKGIPGGDAPSNRDVEIPGAH